MTTTEELTVIQKELEELKVTMKKIIAEATKEGYNTGLDAALEYGKAIVRYDPVANAYVPSIDRESILKLKLS